MTDKATFLVCFDDSWFPKDSESANSAMSGLSGLSRSHSLSPLLYAPSRSWCQGISALPWLLWVAWTGVVAAGTLFLASAALSLTSRTLSMASRSRWSGFRVAPVLPRPSLLSRPSPSLPRPLPIIMCLGGGFLSLSLSLSLATVSLVRARLPPAGVPPFWPGGVVSAVIRPSTATVFHRRGSAGSRPLAAGVWRAHTVAHVVVELWYGRVFVRVELQSWKHGNLGVMLEMERFVREARSSSFLQIYIYWYFP